MPVVLVIRDGDARVNERTTMPLRLECIFNGGWHRRKASLLKGHLFIPAPDGQDYLSSGWAVT